MVHHPRNIYEVTAITVAPNPDRQTATVLTDTAGPIDLALHVSRDTLVLLRGQIDAALINLTPHADK